MSRVDISPYFMEPLDYRASSTLNDIFTAFEDQSGQLDWENFAEEGLDRTCFQDVVHGQRLKTVSDNTRVALPSGTAGWTTFTMGGTAFRTSSVGVVNSHRLIRVLSVVYFESDVVGQHGIPVDQLEMRHEYRANAGAAAAIAGSHAKKTGNTIASGLESRRHATIAIESWLFGPIDDLNWVELSYQLPGAVDAYPSKAFLLLDAFDSLLVL